MKGRPAVAQSKPVPVTRPCPPPEPPFVSTVNVPELAVNVAMGDKFPVTVRVHSVLLLVQPLLQPTKVEPVFSGWLGLAFATNVTEVPAVYVPPLGDTPMVPTPFPAAVGVIV